MPRRYHASTYRPPPSWLSINRSISKALKPRVVSILASTLFYDRHDLGLPGNLNRRTLNTVEKYAAERIASTLTIAADCAHAAPPGIVKAWLEKIATDPSQFWAKRYPAEVGELIECEYRRVFEAPGRHFEDLMNRRKIQGLGKPKQATLLNISRAARRAARSLPRKTGRPKNVANEVLAERLGALFISIGGRIARHQIREEKTSTPPKNLQDGSFYRFVREVIEPLNAHLRAHDLPVVSSTKIEKIAAERFNGTTTRRRPVSSSRV